MYKMRTSQKRKLTLAWTNISDVEASRILQMFNDEYFYVRFPDLLTGTRITRRFYAGDRTGAFRWYDLPLKGTVLGTLSFDVIER